MKLDFNYSALKFDFFLQLHFVKDLFGILTRCFADVFGIVAEQWLKWKVRGGGNVDSGVGPLFVVVGPAAVVTVSPHGQSFL